MTYESESNESGWWFPVALLLAVPLSLFAGWVVASLWGWFIEPLSGVVLSVPNAAGAMLLLRYVTYRHRKDERQFIVVVITGLMHGLITYGVGYVLHLIAT